MVILEGGTRKVKPLEQVHPAMVVTWSGRRLCLTPPGAKAPVYEQRPVNRACGSPVDGALFIARRALAPRGAGGGCAAKNCECTPLEAQGYRVFFAKARQIP